jgi:hypothetical protein
VFARDRLYRQPDRLRTLVERSVPSADEALSISGKIQRAAEMTDFEFPLMEATRLRRSCLTPQHLPDPSKKEKTSLPQTSAYRTLSLSFSR